MADLTALTQAIEAGDRVSAVRLAGEAVDASVDPQEILDAMTQAMAETGARFQRNDIYVPEMLISARAMKEAMAVLEPVLVGAGIKPEATAVLGTVKGDLHDIGKNLVGMMWKGANIEVIDLGTNVSAERFAEAAREHGAHLVGISALLTTTMIGMKDVVDAIRAADMPDVKVIIGGAPVTAEFAREIGADGYAPPVVAVAAKGMPLLRGAIGRPRGFRWRSGTKHRSRTDERTRQDARHAQGRADGFPALGTPHGPVGDRAEGAGDDARAIRREEHGRDRR
jgi:5-methyltetrahydrofolate--homocysteine methyltransferase